MAPRRIGVLIGVILVVTGIVLASLPLENELPETVDNAADSSNLSRLKAGYITLPGCGSALATNKSALQAIPSAFSAICEKKIRDRRIISGVVAGSGVLTLIIASGVFARTKTPLRQEPEPQWKEVDPKQKGEKKFCSQCGEKLTVGAKFCSACGTVI